MLLDGEILGSVIGVSEVLDPEENQVVVVPLFVDILSADFDREMLEDEEVDTVASETGGGQDPPVSVCL